MVSHARIATDLSAYKDVLSRLLSGPKSTPENPTAEEVSSDSFSTPYNKTVSVTMPTHMVAKVKRNG